MSAGRGGSRYFTEEALHAAFVQGFRSGVGRVATTGGAVDTAVVDAAIAPLGQRLAEQHDSQPLEPHAVALLTELTSIAAAVRQAHGEEPLNQADIDEFLPAAFKFLNTYVGCANPK